MENGKSVKKGKLKATKISVLISLVLLICLTVFLTNIKGDFFENPARNQEKTLRSFKKVNDYPLYVMTYYGDYGFDDYLKKGKQVAFGKFTHREDWACSCIAGLNHKGEKIFGRNFDWYYSPNLLLFTDPPKAYASVSMVDMRYLGFLTEKDINEASDEELKILLDSPYLPFDGMNECGLAVGEMTAVGTRSSINPNKVTVGANTVMRLILDYAKDVDDAIKLLENYNIHFPPAPPLHYQISDVKGNSAVIEYIDGEMKITRNNGPWQVSTNFLMYGLDEETRKRRCSRYRRAWDTLEEKRGLLTNKEIMDILKDISQGSTQWSIVYNMTTGDINVAMARKYDDILKFKLQMKK